MRSIAKTNCVFCLYLGLWGSACERAQVENPPYAVSHVLGSPTSDYCELPAVSQTVSNVRPGATEDPIDDVNWFARPVVHEGTDHIVAFASHNQNYLYNLTSGVRVKIPDRSDAVATPDGRYITVPSFYTPDSLIRFYPVKPMLERLETGEDAVDVEPVFIHNHPAMKRVYYQSTAVISENENSAGIATTYRLMFSGTADESQFRIVDYVFTHDATTGRLLGVEPSSPMRVCPEVHNDLNTPFISKDGRYVAAYTSNSEESVYTNGASLKVFEILSADPVGGTTSCREVVDFGYAAGKADFSFDGTMLTFHISQGAYLTPFVNGGLPSGTITDIVVARFRVDEGGNIVGNAGAKRLTTSIDAGVGSYFPAFFPDGSLFYIGNSVPRDSDKTKRFNFTVMDPTGGQWHTEMFATEQHRVLWTVLARHWESVCTPDLLATENAPFPFKPHEAPWLALSLTSNQCHALVADTKAATDTDGDVDWESMSEFCSGLP